MHRSMSLAAALIAVVIAYSGALFAYTLFNPVVRWDLTSGYPGYLLNPSNKDGLSSDDVQAAMEAGAAVWNTAADATWGADFRLEFLGIDRNFQKVVSCCDPYNKVFFRNASSSNAIATTYTWYIDDEIQEFDMIFWDRRMTFFTHAQEGCRRGFFVEGIFAHEAGHGAGIGHSNVSGTTMYPSVSYCNTSIEMLHQDDKDALVALYPSSVDSNDPPTAVVAGGPYSSEEDTGIGFDGTESSDPNDDPLSYAWTFGDGSIGTGVAPNHIYQFGGTFTVTLTVSDGHGGSDTATATATVTELNDVPTADAGGPYSGTVDQPVMFDASDSSDFDNEDGSGANDQVLTYTWNFGDGLNMSTSNPSATHTYAAPGSFDVTLTVSDGDDTSALVQAAADVTNVPDLSGEITLSANGYKVKGRKKVDLEWNDATGANVDIYREGSLIATTANDGAYTDNMDTRGGGSYVYQVCDEGTCSDTVTVSF